MIDSFTLPMLEWCEIWAGRVTIERKDHYVEAFCISKYPVTYGQFQAFLEASDGFQNDAWWQGLATRETEPGNQEWPIDNHPREHVNWYDAIAFCRWLSEKTGLAVSLPTEQQWQRAAQGDDGRAYPWGNQFDSRRCNTREYGVHRTTPVDHYRNGASPYDVYDMAGNAWEWCLNNWENPEDTDPAEDARRVVRGGSWDRRYLSARTFARYYGPARLRSGDVGFRMVCALLP